MRYFLRKLNATLRFINTGLAAFQSQSVSLVTYRTLDPDLVLHTLTTRLCELPSLYLHNYLTLIPSFNYRTTLTFFSFPVASAHSPENLFLGFAIDKVVAMETSQVASLNHTTKSGDKPIGLLYAKDAYFLLVRETFIVCFCRCSLSA